MPKLLSHFILLLTLSLSQTGVAQDTDIDGTASKKTIPIIDQEKARVLKAFQDFNNGDPHIVKTANHLLATSKTSYAKTAANLLLAYYYKNKTAIDSSIYYVNQSLKYNTQSSDSLRARGNAIAYNILAINYKNKGLLDESKKWHQKGISETQKFEEIDLYYTHIHGLALTYSTLENYEEALIHFKECLKYNNDPELIMGSYINMSDIYTQLNKFDTAISYLEKAKKLADKSQSSQAHAVIALNLGINYEKLSKYEEAITQYTSANTIAEEFNLHTISLTAKNNLGGIFTYLGQYQDAELILSSALHDAITLGLLADEMDIYNALKFLAAKKENYKSALDFSNKSSQLKDSIHQLQKDEDINILEVKYQTLKKEKEIRLLTVENANRDLELKHQEEAIKNLRLKQQIKQQENENMLLEITNTKERIQNENIILKKDSELQQAEANRQKTIRNIIIYSFIIMLLLVIGLLIIYYQKQQTKHELNKQREEISAQKIAALIKDQKLKLINAAVEGKDKERKRIAQELHDSIGGNLAAIKLQLNNSSNLDNAPLFKTISTQLDDTYEQVRNLSHNLMPKKFKEQKFSNILEEYFNNIGNSSNLTTTISVYPRAEIDALMETIQIEIFKIIQELIANTIKHAKASTITLELNVFEDHLSMLFEDNGLGFETKNATDGIGFRNIKSRLKKIKGSLSIDSRINRGTIINIEIPTQTLAQNDL
ncbi:tetratricopeptide repeat-containing sensor histidine kinase [Pseudotamlana agarivorans]|uniref:tetratricopeptide repeat-containing sensor histidine kinase n=1 Tax=Pseudotamlana agarivorans TaxID=481183 RepID=UPI00082A45B8|nr:tetratricopeptide repeat protein [Tamlana agarivorans]